MAAARPTPAPAWAAAPIAAARKPEDRMPCFTALVNLLRSDCFSAVFFVVGVVAGREVSVMVKAALCDMVLGFLLFGCV